MFLDVLNWINLKDPDDSRKIAKIINYIYLLEHNAYLQFQKTVPKRSNRP